jgi:hypothetical protein
MRFRVGLTGALIVAGAVAGTATGAEATQEGNPPTVNACMGMVTAYGDHPEMSPAFFAKYIDGVSVQTLMQWDRAFCNSIR